ncbi:copper resistance CopC/CopD family protein [Natrinema salifodinae]|uniref:Copper transport protein n=1 Tax=Natrinema salifodinae TaxID=1202768 RepID=A0A1I0PAM7_9EURY|nr:copper resistance protein CopC [Natrinema salifodinae]SEW11169.1 copper transport protein [Natrinema salifodinae]
MPPGESLERTPGDRSHRSRPRRAWLLVGLVVAVVVLPGIAAPVAAHAYLSDSDPSNGDQVASVPDEVTLTFGGDGVQTADVAVTGPDGEDVSGDAAVDADDSRIVRVPLADAADGEDADGMYTVRWSILADDGHETSGSFVFSVGDEPLDRDAVLAAYETDGEETDESVPPVEIAAKGLLLVALVGLVGGPVTAAVAVYPVAARFDSSGRTVDRRLIRAFAAAGGLLLVSVLALGLSRAASVGPPSVETIVEFAGTALGRAWLLQLALATILLVVLALAAAGSLSRRVWLPGTAVGATYVGATVSWTSHSATAIDRLQGTAVDFAHIGGAGLWVGGLVVLALVVPPVLRETAPADRAALAAGTIRRYSLLALGGVTLAAATGFLLAAWHVPTVESLSANRYGVVLSAKFLLVLLALGLGGLTRFGLLRRLEPGADGDRGRFAERLFGGRSEADSEMRVREDGGQADAAAGTITAFTRAVRFEVAVLVLVVLLSGVLTSVPTAAVGGEDDGLESATIEREGDVGVELTAIPAEHDGDGGDSDEQLLVQAGEPIVFEAAFRAGGEPLESERTVRLLADGPDGDRFEVELEETDDGTYATVQTLPADGAWRLRITGEPDSRYVDEWVDVHALSDADAQGHDHERGDDEANERDDQGESGDGDDAGDSLFTAGLRVVALAIGLVGTVAVAVEAVRFRGRAD